jgi:hypothetical protein
MIDEDVSEIGEIEVLWEGYADQCTQAELYIWDIDNQQWGDGRGLIGQNRYLDNWAGNQDGYLLGAIQSDFSRYVAVDGTFKILVYAERSGDETFHDYVSVTINKPNPIQIGAPDIQVGN